MSPTVSPTDGLPSSHSPAEKIDQENGSYLGSESSAGKVDGARSAEAAYKVYGRTSKWFLFAG